MRLLAVIILSAILGLGFASIMNSTDYWKARRKKIFGWFCTKSGGRDFRAVDNWTFECDYVVDKNGEIIKP